MRHDNKIILATAAVFSGFIALPSGTDHLLGRVLGYTVAFMIISGFFWMTNTLTRMMITRK